MSRKFGIILVAASNILLAVVPNIFLTETQIKEWIDWLSPTPPWLARLLLALGIVALASPLSYLLYTWLANRQDETTPKPTSILKITFARIFAIHAVSIAAVLVVALSGRPEDPTWIVFGLLTFGYATTNRILKFAWEKPIDPEPDATSSPRSAPGTAVRRKKSAGASGVPARHTELRDSPPKQKRVR